MIRPTSMQVRVWSKPIEGSLLRVALPALLIVFLILAACSKPVSNSPTQKTSADAQTPPQAELAAPVQAPPPAAPMAPVGKPQERPMRQEKMMIRTPATPSGTEVLQPRPLSPELPITQSVESEPIVQASPVAAPLGPSPAPPVVIAHQVIVAAGTLIPVRTIDSIDSRTDQVGQTFRASIETAVVVDDEVAIPRGSTVYLKLTRAASAGEVRGKSELQLELDRIVIGNRTYSVESNVIQRSGEAEGPKTARDVGIGAAIGAAVGAIAGGGKGAAVGAAAGAGAGAVAAVVTKGEQVLVQSETLLDFRLECPVEIEVAPAASVPAASRMLGGPRRLGEDQSSPRAERDREGASKLSGEWQLSIRGAQGERLLKMFLEKNGDRLSGSIRDPMRGESTLRGSVDKASIRFSTDSIVRGYSIRAEYTGTLLGSRLQGTVKISENSVGLRRGARRPLPLRVRSFEWTAKRIAD